MPIGAPKRADHSDGFNEGASTGATKPHTSLVQYMAHLIPTELSIIIYRQPAANNQIVADTRMMTN